MCVTPQCPPIFVKVKRKRRHVCLIDFLPQRLSWLRPCFQRSGPVPWAPDEAAPQGLLVKSGWSYLPGLKWGSDRSGRSL